MNEADFIDLLSGRRRGLTAATLRAGLLPASWLYRAVIAVRNAWYNRWSLPVWLEVPVISVGNLTVGGTGKTPMSIGLCRRLLERGLKPAVLSRGYRADEEGRADELMLIARLCPKAVAVGNPDRAAAGRLAIEEYSAQVAILDDGFQHRRLGRDLDIVLIDALAPWGLGHLLPRGLLREPVHNLRRADAVIVTRCDQADAGALEQIEARVHRIKPELPILRSAHRPAGWVDLDGREAALPDGARVGCFAGIARPEAFAHTLTDLGHSPAATYWWPDHHVYTADDHGELLAWARDARLDALITTEKDAVKLRRLTGGWPVPVVCLRVEIELWGEGDKILGRLIDEMLREHQNGSDADTRPHEPTDAGR